jgi:hypothetical protein
LLSIGSGTFDHLVGEAVERSRGRRHTAPIPEPVEQPRRLRRRSIEWVEEIEGDGIEANALARRSLDFMHWAE